MPAVVLLCSACRGKLSPDEPIWSCPSCGGLLELQLDLSGLATRTTCSEGTRTPDTPQPDTPAEAVVARLGGLRLSDVLRGNTTALGLWRYAAVIPLNAADPVSMGEGDTPVVPLGALGRHLGLPRLYAKLEFFSPTCSFKDRGATVMVTKARELGVGRLVEDSSGNAGASIAAYCARAGIQASIYVPASAPAAKKAQIAYYGAEVVAVDGTRDDVTEAALERCRREGAYYGSHNWNPFFLEGTKTFAYEVAERFGCDLPEHIVVPVGNGSLYLGAWKGFRELQGLGLVERVPRMHVAQATGCMPIVDAYRRGLDRTEVIPTFPTVAGGISIGRPSRGHLILEAMRESAGAGAAVSDEEILEFQQLLASLEGIFCEPTSAAAFAALPRLVQQGSIDPQERVVVAVTGMGLKDTSVLLPS